MAKMVKCKTCGGDVAKGAKACPACGKDNRSFFGKHKIISGFLVLVLLVIFVNAASGGSKNSGTATNTQPAAATTTPAATATVAPATPAVPAVPAEYKSALSQADTYANTMSMSKVGVYNQLVSEYGGKFTKEAGQYAIDNVNADWDANALASAKTYQEKMSMSPASIRDQLVSKYGGNFTEEQADYAIKHLND